MNAAQQTAIDDLLFMREIREMQLRAQFRRLRTLVAKRKYERHNQRRATAG